MEETIELKETNPAKPAYRTTALAVGGLIGALVGMGAAYLLTVRAEQSGQAFKFTPGKGVKLGVMIAGVLRSILSLGEE
jgi:hypothetical protein